MTSATARVAVLLIRMADECAAALADPAIDPVSRQRLEWRYARLVQAMDDLTGTKGRQAA